MEFLLKRSLEDKMKLDIIYVSKSGDVTQRTIRVVRIREDHVAAYCFERREVRTFRRENILSLFPHHGKKKQRDIS
ncbi:hypothetical protein LCM20_00415 [Halobacillus litoralis]|uniref:WYL domain-containing protein n=1 Tax=Halobacillus litoralis TaxID=45668 RepID=UPI001CD71B3F|nr:hypothetical protein [Halobacillus litoralis]MCA0969046.1 hypothetical protein [Halobacillus litoralis]